MSSSMKIGVSVQRIFFFGMLAVLIGFFHSQNMRHGLFVVNGYSFSGGQDFFAQLFEKIGFSVLAEFVLVSVFLLCLLPLVRFRLPEKKFIASEVAALEFMYHEEQSRQLAEVQRKANKKNSVCDVCGMNRIDVAWITTEGKNLPMNHCLICQNKWPMEKPLGVKADNVLFMMFRSMSDFFDENGETKVDDPVRRIHAETIRYYLRRNFSFMHHYVIDDLRRRSLRQLRRYCRGGRFE